MKGRQLSPSMLRIILSITLVLFFALGVGVFILGYKKLGSVNTEAQTIAMQEQESQSGLSRLMTTKKLLEDNASTVTRASQLAAQSRSYIYQDQIINDINKYATEAGLSITDITFADAKTTSAGGSTASASSPSTSSASGPSSATGATGATGTNKTAGTTPAGVKSVTAQITTENPIDYNSLLTFLHLVEQSLFRMQISQISLSRSDAAGSNQISSNTLTIEVFIR